MSSKRVPRSINTRDGFVTSTPIPTTTQAVNTFAAPATTTSTALVPAGMTPAQGLTLVQTTVSALTPAAETITGNFYTSGRYIIDPHGNRFRPFGGNVPSRHSPPGIPYILNYHDVDAIGHSADAAFWGWSAIRLNVFPHSQDYYSLSGLRDWVVAAIQEYSAREIVCFVSAHYQPAGRDWNLGNPEWDIFNQFWAMLVADTRVINNPWWWVGYINENFTSGSETTNWLAVENDHYNRVRAIDPNRIYAVEVPGFGQGYKQVFDNGTLQTFLSGKHNVVVEWHNYGSGQTTASMTATMNDYIAAGIPYFSGECGSAAPGSSAVGATSQADDIRGVAFTYDVQHQQGFGSMYWHAVGTGNANNEFALKQQAGANGTFADFSYPFTPNGQTVWDRGHESHNLGPGNTGGTGPPVQPPVTTDPYPGGGPGSGGTTTPGPGNGNGGTGGTGTNARTVYFTDITAGNPTTWSWEFRTAGGALLGTSTVQNPFYTFPAAGSYRVSLAVDVSTHATVKEVTVT